MSTNRLDTGNIFRSVYEPSSESLNVNIKGSGSPSLPNVVEISDGTDFITSTVDGSKRALDVSVINTPELVIDNTTDSIAIGTPTQLFTGTTVLGKTGLDVNVIAGAVTGTLNPTGLKTDLKTTRMTVTDVAVKVPVVDLLNRNTMSVRILGINTVFFGDSTVTEEIGYPKFSREEMVLDIQANASVDLWAVCAAGKTCEIAILEIA